MVSGSVTFGGFERRADPLGNVSVTVSQGAASAQAVSAADGAYRLSLPTPDMVTTATLSAWLTGFVPVHRAVRVGPRTELLLSLALEPLPALDCIDGACLDDTASVRWLGGSSTATARAAWLTGSSVPSTPNVSALLVAVAFEATEAPAGSVRVRLPASSLRDLVDARPGTGAIEVETQLLTAQTRAWQAGPLAVLQTEAGLGIDELTLDPLRSGTFRAGVSVLVPVTGNGVIGVFGGPAQRGCVEGSVVLDGVAAEGLTLLPLGAGPAASAADGRVCFEAPLSDTPLSARPQYAAVAYGSVPVPSPTTVGACGSSTCRALGTLSLRSETVAVVAPCSLTVLVVDEVGQPIEGAVVVGMDDGLAQNAFAAICGKLGSRCTLTQATNAEGRASLVVPVQNGVTVEGRARTDVRFRTGQLALPTCPREAVTLRLDVGLERVGANATFTGDTISWAPARAATGLKVARDGGVVWQVNAPSTMAPPVRLGVAPAQTSASGVPGAAQPGDVVQVSFDAVSGDVATTGSASATRE